jgi:glycerol-3-phosphate dehydrogenase (NAD(P)+)
MKKQSVAVLGAGNMGTALAYIIAKNGYTVDLWNWSGDSEPLHQIAEFHENKKYLPGVNLSKKIRPVHDIEKAVENKKIVFLCVSTGAMRSVIGSCAQKLSLGALLVDVSKGLDEKTGKTIPEIIEELTKKKKVEVLSLSGPAVASQMVAGDYTALVVAGDKKKSCEQVIEVLQNKFLRLHAVTDSNGVEYVQTLKNVYAIGLGIVEGLGLGKNTQAIFFAAAVGEMMEFLKIKKCDPATALGLCGIGDLFTTSQSVEGRNRKFGLCLAEGKSVEESLCDVFQTVEGKTAIVTFEKIIRKKMHQFPFFFFIYSVVEKKKLPGKALAKFFETM